MAGYCSQSGAVDKFCIAGSDAVKCPGTVCPPVEVPDGFVWVKGEPFECPVKGKTVTRHCGFKLCPGKEK